MQSIQSLNFRRLNLKISATSMFMKYFNKFTNKPFFVPEPLLALFIVSITIILFIQGNQSYSLFLVPNFLHWNFHSKASTALKNLLDNLKHRSVDFETIRIIKIQSVHSIFQIFCLS